MAMFQENIAPAELHELRIALADREARLNTVAEVRGWASWRRDPATGRTTTSELMQICGACFPGKRSKATRRTTNCCTRMNVLQQRTLVKNILAKGGTWHTESSYPSARRQSRMARGTRHGTG